MLTTPLIEHDKSEFRRMAGNIEHFNTLLHDMLLEACGKDELPIGEFDRLKGLYRDWLVFNNLPVIEATIDGAVTICTSVTAYSRERDAYRVHYRDGESGTAVAWVNEQNIKLS